MHAGPRPLVGSVTTGVLWPLVAALWLLKLGKSLTLRPEFLEFCFIFGGLLAGSQVSVAAVPLVA